MKTRIILGGLFVAVLLTFLINPNILAGDSKKSSYAANTPAASEYLIEVTHTPESCLKALDEVKDLGPGKLNEWSWGCKYGNHTGYLLVKASSETVALNAIPASDRDHAKVLPLGKFTAEDIASFHKQMGK